MSKKRYHQHSTTAAYRHTPTEQIYFVGYYDR